MFKMEKKIIKGNLGHGFREKKVYKSPVPCPLKKNSGASENFVESSSGRRMILLVE